MPTEHRAAPPVPQCPYCGTDWTPAMQQQLRRHSGISCACCDGGHHVVRVPLPLNDLCCDSCGKPIYRAAVPASPSDPGPAHE